MPKFNILQQLGTIKSQHASEDVLQMLRQEVEMYLVQWFEKFFCSKNYSISVVPVPLIWGIGAPFETCKSTKLLGSRSNFNIISDNTTKLDSRSALNNNGNLVFMGFKILDQS